MISRRRTFNPGVFLRGVADPVWLRRTPWDSVLFCVIRNEPKSMLQRGGGVSSPCSDNFYDELDWVESDQHEWHFKAGSQPGHLTEAEAVQALRDGTSDITQQNNSCGLSDQAGMTTNYIGQIQGVGAQMGSDGGCASYVSRDSLNLVDFGDLPTGLVGKNCEWRLPLIGKDELQESDIRLNKADHKWILEVGQNCGPTDDKYDIESVMAHERGHTFSLDDISEANHGYLTMSAEGENCSTAPRTLGLGDVVGFRANY